MTKLTDYFIDLLNNKHGYRPGKSMVTNLLDYECKCCV